MALTVSQEPQLFTPAYNDQLFTALSTQIAQTDFKYIVTIQINSGTIYTYNFLQRPDGYLVFNAKEMVSNYIIRSYFNPTNTAVLKAGDKSCFVHVVIKEYYTGSVQSTTNIDYVAWDACLTDDDFRDYVYTDYCVSGTDVLLLSPNATEFLFPDDRVTTNTDLWIHFFRNNCTDVVQRVYNTSNTLIGTSSASIPTTDGLIYYFNIGVPALAFAALVGYRVEFDILNGASVKFSGEYTVTEICTKHIQYIVYYLKRNGNIGYFHFELVSEEGLTKATNQVRLNPQVLTSGVYGSNAWDREQNTVSTQTPKSITLNTNFITESQSESLAELFDSPIIWVKNPSGAYKAISVKDTSYTYKKHENQTLFNYTINCEYSVRETRQRGL